MKPLHLIPLIAIVFAAGWLAGNWRHQEPPSQGPQSKGESKVLYYQSPMHPWIKSDAPGRCTICGMQLVAIHEGEQGFSEGTGQVSLTQSQIQVLHVETDQAKIEPLAKTLRVAGRIEDDNHRHRFLSAYIDGRIDKLFANHVGIEVAEGQPLALLYSPALLQAEREYKQLTGALRESTALRLRQMGLTPAQIAALPDKPADALSSEILSPMSGTVVTQSVYEGQYVTTGQQLLELADFSIMWFLFRAYEQDMPWVRPGQEVEVTTPSLPGRVFPGKVTFIDPNFDEATRSTLVRVELPNPLVDGRRELLHRLYAEGAVKVDAPPMLTIPRSAVIETGPQAVVYVDQDGGNFARREIALGRRGDKRVEVLTGVQAGDRVVTNGNLLMDGQAEMNRAFMTPVEPTDSSIPMASLTASQKAAVSSFVVLVDGMAAALAADDLAAFEKASAPAMQVTEALTSALRDDAVLRPGLDRLATSSHFHGFSDLPAARAAFHPFTVAASAILEPLRLRDGTPEFDVWECGMVSQIIPGVPPSARWIQTKGRPGQNPFFGQDMLDCAKEIKRLKVAP
jgi:Cu(I)/Ag(I) efflux system membrane fusion protein